MVCANCRASNPDGSSFCSQCGALFGAQPGAGTPPAYTTGVRMPYQNTQQAYYPVVAPRTDIKAIFSLILAVVSPLCCCFAPIPAIPAIILGHISRNDIRRSQGQLRGEGLAIAGLVIGYIMFLFPIAFWVRSAHQAPEERSNAESVAAEQVRSLAILQIHYSAKYPEQGYAPSLAVLGSGVNGNCSQPDANHACLLENELTASNCKDGHWCKQDEDYEYILQATPGEPHRAYAITARPVYAFNQWKTFCATGDGVVRSGKSLTYRFNAYTVEQCMALPPYKEP